MKPEVKKTTDYGLFKMNEHQQPMSPAHVKRLIASMEKYGFLASKPLTVVPDGLHLRLIDGHHRLEAAKTLGIPVYYLIEARDIAPCIGDINYTVKKWVGSSFAKMYAAEGNPHYRTLLNYIEKGVPMQQAASMLVLQSAYSNNAIRNIQNGEYRVKSTAMIDALIGLWDECASVAPEVKHKSFIQAYSMLYFVKQFDIQTFIKRLLANPTMLVKCSSREQMLDVIEDIYNFRAREKLALKHMACEVQAKRQKTFGR